MARKKEVENKLDLEDNYEQWIMAFEDIHRS